MAEYSKDVLKKKKKNSATCTTGVCSCVYSGGVLYSEDAAAEGWRVSSREQQQSSGHHYDSR